MTGNGTTMKETIIQIVLDHCPATPGIYLFWSQADENARPESDVDVALLLSPEQASALGDLQLSACAFDLDDALARHVDLLNARQVSTVM